MILVCKVQIGYLLIFHYPSFPAIFLHQGTHVNTCTGHLMLLPLQLFLFAFLILIVYLLLYLSLCCKRLPWQPFLKYCPDNPFIAVRGSNLPLDYPACRAFPFNSLANKLASFLLVLHSCVYQKMPWRVCFPSPPELDYYCFHVLKFYIIFN